LRAASNFATSARYRCAAASIAARCRILQLFCPLALLVRHRAARLSGGGELDVGEIYDRHGNMLAPSPIARPASCGRL